MGLPGFDPHSGIPSNAQDEALVKKMNLTATEPFDPPNAAAPTADSAPHVTTGTQLFQRTNGRPVTDTVGWQTEANVNPFESAHQAVPFLPYQSEPYGPARSSGQTFEDRRLMSSQQQSDFDSPAVLRSLVDQSAATSAAPSSSADMSELLKLRSIIQAVGSRGLFPIQ